MKRLLFICALAIAGIGQSYAQDMDADDLGIFNHVGAAVGFGTTGVSIDVAVPITPYFALRGGVDIFPKFEYKTDLKLDFDNTAKTAYQQMFGETLPEEIGVKGNPALGAGHVLLDIFPAKNSSFHLTVGAYFGKSDIASVWNTNCEAELAKIYQYNHDPIREQQNLNKIGVDLGDYFLEPDANGKVDASLKVKSFRPYVGIGFGRPVPMKSRLTCNFDMGVQFWGKPEVYLQDKKLESGSTNDKNADNILKTISKIQVYPVLNVRLVGRIF